MQRRPFIQILEEFWDSSDVEVASQSGVEETEPAASSASMAKPVDSVVGDELPFTVHHEQHELCVTHSSFREMGHHVVVDEPPSTLDHQHRELSISTPSFF